jgi:cysteine-rich repeat protein
VLGLEALAGGCDDDNERPDDGCSPSCTVEMSFACSGEPSTCNKTCGNGQVEQGETCDDENTAVGDGCVSCAVESGFECEPGTMPSDCSDVNECADNKHNCHAQATCTNTAGSFSCACKPGYTGTGVNCSDVNECADNKHNCHAQATCTNTAGSFSCACKGGLTGNGVSCSFAQLVGKLDGRLITVPCSDTPPADDCTITGAVSEGVTKACSAGQLDAIYDHPIGGPPGVEYTATLHFYGVAEPRSYGPGVTREAGLVQPENLDTGASPAPYGLGAVGGAIRVSSYSTLEVRVFDQSSVEVGSYFLNSDTGEGHYTYVLNYERPIRIVGGGFVRVRRVDTNCRIIKNCNGGTDCGNEARSVDISAANPQPVGLVQPGLGQPAAHSGQWLLVDVTKVELL